MSTRYAYITGLIIISFLVAFSLYVELHDGFTPCPLCILQRLTFCLLAVLFFFGMMLPVKSFFRFIVPILSILTSLLGMLLAGRQIWLQNFPPANGECGVTIQYMIQVLPLSNVIQKVFSGTAECTQRGWIFLSFSMAEWALVCFTLFLFFTIYLFVKEWKRG